MGAGRGRSGQGRQRPRVSWLQLKPERGPALLWARPQPARALTSKGQRQDVILAVLGPGLTGAWPGPEAEPLTQDKSYVFVSSKSGKIPGLTGG